MRRPLRLLGRFLEGVNVAIVASGRFAYRHNVAAFYLLFAANVVFWVLPGKWADALASITIWGAAATAALGLGGSFGRQDGREEGTLLERRRILRIIDGYQAKLDDALSTTEQKATGVATGLVRDAVTKHP